MTRYRINLEYDGSNLIGWQQNIQGVSVQSLLQDAIFKFCGQKVEVIGCGRTDAGVHAISMPAHLDIESGEWRVESEDISTLHSSLSTLTVMRAVNFWLGQVGAPVSVLSVEEVPDDWHARFSCRQRHYRYVIVNRTSPAVLDRGRAWWIPRKLDVKKMRDAAQKLLGEHDWTSFRASECQAKSPIKTVDEITINASLTSPRRGNTAAPLKGGISTDLNSPFQGGGGAGIASRGDVGEECDGVRITIDISARSFLHHQVRNIVGTLVEIGLGKPLDIDEIFKAKDRSAAGATAPACGLYFVSAEY